ncbi:MAG: ATP-binding protein [Bacteroidota bacterium]
MAKLQISMLIGRKREQEILLSALNSDKAEMIAVVGRRRVGKTFLINSVYEKHIVFQQTGVRKASLENQLRTFKNSLELFSGDSIDQPKDWLDAFFQLRKKLEPFLTTKGKVVLFFDELSWLAGSNSDFLDFLGHFWNDWASKQPIVIVLCGSVSSWIIKKVINDKGGLHNRVTQYIHLKPFSLAETEAFLLSKNIKFTHYQIVQLYMAMGGIPLYLEAIKAGQSVVKAIDDICFSENGLLKNEFNRLYAALFDNPDYHIEIIRALANKRKGLSRSQIIASANIPNGGAVTRVLEELQQSDFIMAYQPFGKKKKGKLYRLTDEYSLFYLKFIEENRYLGQGTWQQLSQTQAYKVWAGYAYEGICMKHIPQIKWALGVGGVYAQTYSFSKKATEEEEGLQLDMVMERADRVIHIFEIKFYNSEFVLTKEYAQKLRERQQLFQSISKNRKLLFLTFITTFGLRTNQHSIGLVDQSLSLEDLFTKVR